jgi:hypothetical protein
MPAVAPCGGLPPPPPFPFHHDTLAPANDPVPLTQRNPVRAGRLKMSDAQEMLNRCSGLGSLGGLCARQAPHRATPCICHEISSPPLRCSI